MVKRDYLEFSTKGLDDLFSTQEERNDEQTEKVQLINIDLINDFNNHPFKVLRDERMQEMIESVKEYGVLVPAIIRPVENGFYEMVAGHRRKASSLHAGLDSLPCLVRQMSDEEATIIMVDSNLQREEILPSEKAYAYRMKLEAIKSQGKRRYLTSVETQQKLKGVSSRELLSRNSSDSQDKIRAYIRLTELTPTLLEMVDQGKIALRPAVEISYLSKEKQESLFATMESEDCTPSLAQAIKMKQSEQKSMLNDEVIMSIMSEQKPNQIEHFKMPRARISRFFPADATREHVENTIVKALEQYQKQKSRDSVKSKDDCR